MASLNWINSVFQSATEVSISLVFDMISQTYIVTTSPAISLLTASALSLISNQILLRLDSKPRPPYNDHIIFDSLCSLIAICWWVFRSCSVCWKWYVGGVLNKKWLSELGCQEGFTQRTNTGHFDSKYSLLLMGQFQHQLIAYWSLLVQYIWIPNLVLQLLLN